MIIKEMSNDASLDLLSRMRLGRLACTQGSQPYIVPFYFAYQDYCLYSFTTVGKKIEWMRANPLVCVEVDDVMETEEWTSVVVSGCYEELPDTPKWQRERTFAVKLLQQYAMWWEPALARTQLPGKSQPPVPVFYRIRIVGITGRCAIVTP